MFQNDKKNYSIFDSMKNNEREGQFAWLYDLAFNPVLHRVHNSIVSLAKKYNCHSIIDLGSGTGAQARVLSHHGFSVTGVDASPEMIVVSQKKSPDSITFIKDDIRFISFKEKSFDAANICLVLHPNSFQAIIQILDKAKSLIKPEGVIFITDYGQGTRFSGRIANLIIRIIESCAQQDHRVNYYSFMSEKGVDMFSSWSDFTLLDKLHYFNGSLQTLVLKR